MPRRGLLPFSFSRIGSHRSSETLVTSKDRRRAIWKAPTNETKKCCQGCTAGRAKLVMMGQ